MCMCISAYVSANAPWTRMHFALCTLYRHVHMYCGKANLWDLGASVGTLPFGGEKTYFTILNGCYLYDLVGTQGLFNGLLWRISIVNSPIISYHLWRCHGFHGNVKEPKHMISICQFTTIAALWSTRSTKSFWGVKNITSIFANPFNEQTDNLQSMGRKGTSKRDRRRTTKTDAENDKETMNNCKCSLSGCHTYHIILVPWFSLVMWYTHY